MTGYSFGDVVLVPFPFTDQSNRKKRLAAVIGSDAYHQAKPDFTGHGSLSRLGTT